MATNSEKIMWYWQSNDDPFSNKQSARWNAYSDADIQTIEDAYQSKKKTVKIGNYMIDIDSKLQIKINDPSKVRPIMRECISKVVETNNPLRQQRFFSEEPKFTKSFDEVHEKGSKFIIDWKEKILANDSEFKQCVRQDLRLKRCADLAGKGIIIEGNELGRSNEAKAISIELTNAGTNLFQIVVKLYTNDSFLYPEMNKALREKDFSKLSTFGPYVYLLHQLLIESSLMVYNTTVYRGALLSAEMIEQYKSSEGEIAKWLGFSSTSRNRSKSENWLGSNTLFIIDIKQEPHPFDCGYDISRFSSFPNEEEVLLLAGGRFKIERVDFDTASNKYFIYLSVF
ncbi:unnamed protein product [Rotaria sp. Silwood1]|nr:unnamed protein product [Rotaria sp. Silwood1]